MLINKDELFCTTKKLAVNSQNSNNQYGFIKRFFANNAKVNNHRLSNMVANISLKIGLTKEQHVTLLKLAQQLDSSLSVNENKILEESLLLNLLQGSQYVKENILRKADVGGADMDNAQQRNIVENCLIGLEKWLASLNEYQRQIVSQLQQRSFRLSMG